MYRFRRLSDWRPSKASWVDGKRPPKRSAPHSKRRASNSFTKMEAAQACVYESVSAGQKASGQRAKPIVEANNEDLEVGPKNLQKSIATCCERRPTTDTSFNRFLIRALLQFRIA